VDIDYRFTLANERTFLAYLRTALALDVAALAVAQFVQLEPRWLGAALSIVLAVAGIATGIVAVWRWRGNERAIERDRPLPQNLAPVGLALAVAVVSAIVLVLVFG